MRTIQQLFTMMISLSFLLFASCNQDDNSPETNQDEYETIILSGYKIKSDKPSEYFYKYIDLETLQEVASPSLTEWDIRVTGARQILTNSGVTEVGLGGVACSGSQDFSAIIDSPGALEYTIDYCYWEYYEQSSGGYSIPQQYTVNVMNFPGYSSQNGYNGGAGDGLADGKTEDTAYFRSNIDFTNGNAFAKWAGMPPSFFDYTNNVYVIRSGDGANYYKFQILLLEYITDMQDDGSKKVIYSFEVRTEKIN